jgi:uncharacterized damage-inducible protein DinB
MTRPVLADAFAHHVWATDVILAACENLLPAALVTTVPGTYGTILETLRHLVGADASYLFVLSGGGVARIDEDVMDVTTLRGTMRVHEPVWQEVLAGEPDPDEVLVRRRDDGSATEAPIGVRLAQVIHHGTDHRSQVCTALTALGVEPPDIDVWAWADSRGKLVETPTRKDDPIAAVRGSLVGPGSTTDEVRAQLREEEAAAEARRTGR